MSAPNRVRIDHQWQDDQPSWVVSWTPPRARRPVELRRVAYVPDLDGFSRDRAGELAEEFAAGFRAGLEAS